MITEIINFNTKDEIKLDGVINKNERPTNKVLIQIHGMTSNCFKKREKTIAENLQDIEIDTMRFNNRGSEIIRYVKGNKNTFLGGTAYENFEDCYYDIVGAIDYVINLGYKDIYLQGHSLGCTKILYTYNKLKEENNYILKSIKGIILLSLVDVPGVSKLGTTEAFIKFAEEKEQNGQVMEMMPTKSFIHPISVKNFLKYTKYNQDIDFARFDIKEDEFEVLNKIQCPLFMRWGNVNELIKQDASDLVEFMNEKVRNESKDIGYIDGADHGYHGKEEILANQIKMFLVR